MSAYWKERGLDKRLVVLHAANLGAVKIARTLSEEFHCTITRNAVIGRSHRLGLAGRSREEGLRQYQSEKKQERLIPKARSLPLLAISKPGSMPMPLKVIVACVPVSMFDLRDEHCRYPVSDRPTMYCGGERSGRTSYCIDHHPFMFQPPRNRS